MKTRRSWRNQNRIYKMLSKGDWQTVTQNPVKPKTPVIVTYSESEIDAMFWMRGDERERFKRYHQSKGTLTK